MVGTEIGAGERLLEDEVRVLVPHGLVRLVRRADSHNHRRALLIQLVFFFQAEDGIRDYKVTGVQTCALPICRSRVRGAFRRNALASLSNYYTTLYEPVVDPCYPLTDALRQLTHVIRAEKPSWDVVNLKPLDRDSPVFTGLVDAFRHAGMAVQTYFCHGNWYYPVNGRSYKEYLDSLRSSVRNIASSKNKKLERTGRARVEITVGPDGLDAAIHAYEKIYAASWKIQEPFPHFIPS